jgi:hypothetical protein
MPVKMVLEKKEFLVLDIITKVSAIEVRLKEIEHLAEDMKKIKLQVDLLTKSLEKYAEHLQPIVEKELEYC